VDNESRDCVGLASTSMTAFVLRDTGHDLMITEPNAVTAALLEIATCNSSS